MYQLKGAELFNVHQFLEENFATPDNVKGACAEQNIDTPARDTVRKWFERGSVPAAWLGTLIVVLEKRSGKPASLRKYQQ